MVRSKSQPYTVTEILFNFAIWAVIFIAGYHIGNQFNPRMEDWQCVEYKLVPAQTYTDSKDYMSVCIVRKYTGEFPK
jgi:hypothetical protein